MKNYYEILGVERDATKEEIKKAFKVLAMKYHPDKHDNDELYEEKFKLIKLACDTLTDDITRADYDEKLDILESVENRSYYQNKTSSYEESSNYQSYETYDDNYQSTSSSKATKETTPKVGFWKKLSDYMSVGVTPFEYLKRSFYLTIYCIIGVWILSEFDYEEDIIGMLIFFYGLFLCILTYFRGVNAGISPIIYIFLLNPILTVFVLLYIALKKPIQDKSEIHTFRFTGENFISILILVLLVAGLSSTIFLHYNFVVPIQGNIYNPFQISLYFGILSLIIFFIIDVLVGLYRWYKTNKLTIISLPENDVWVYHIFSYITIFLGALTLYFYQDNFEREILGTNQPQTVVQTEVIEEKPVETKNDIDTSIEQVVDVPETTDTGNSMIGSFQEITQDVNLRKAPGGEIIKVLKSDSLVEIYDTVYYNGDARYSVGLDNQTGFIHNIAFTKKEEEVGLINTDYSNTPAVTPSYESYTPPPQPVIPVIDYGYSCQRKTCGSIGSCAEAYYLLNTCGYGQLDRDKDGVPCETLCN